MVESKPQSKAGPNSPSADDLVNLNGLGERRLQLSDVVRFLGNEGVGEEVVRKLVTATQLMESPDEQLPLIPLEPMTLAEASGHFELSLARLKNWVHVGHLKVIGRERYPARGGGKILVDREAVEYLKLHPPQNGRPRKP